MKITSDLSKTLYHRTEEDRAIKVLKENMFRLSTWLGTMMDKPKDAEHLWFMSTATRPDAYKRGNVVFVLDGEELNKRYHGSPFDYWGEEWRDAAKRNNRDSSDFDEAEERIYSDSPTIPNASKYIKEIHAEWWMPDEGWRAQHAFKRHRNLALFAKRHQIPLYWYEDNKDLDTLSKDKAKRFSDFPAGPSMSDEERSSFKDRGMSAYSYKKWRALLSVEPARTYKDLPDDYRKYLSTSSDGHLGFEADIHNATKNMRAEEMRFIYKLASQMKRVGAKTFKEFYGVMMDKIRRLHLEDRKAKASLIRALKRVCGQKTPRL